MIDTGEARVVRPDREQAVWDTVDLDSQLPRDHRARIVWAFVEGLDLKDLYGTVKAREGEAGRPAADPAVLLALWLYATLEGVGSARLLERLCKRDASYRWLCGWVPVNYHGLADFRVRHEALLDQWLTESVTALLAENIITLEEVALDGTKVAASAGRSSLRGAAAVERYAAAAEARVAKLKGEIDVNPGANERRRRAAVARAEQEIKERAAKARATLKRLEEEKAERAKTHAKQEAEKNAPRVSTSDPEARLMRFADGAVRPGYNLQIGCVPEQKVITEVMVSDRRNDAGLAQPMVEALIKRYDQAPKRALMDTKYATQADIVAFAELPAGPVEVYSPPPAERKQVKSERRRIWKRNREPAAVQKWRARMASDQGKAFYGWRRHIETVNGNLKNRGLGRLLVRGKGKVRCVALFHAIAHNLWRGFVLRAAAAPA